MVTDCSGGRTVINWGVVFSQPNDSSSGYEELERGQVSEADFNNEDIL